MPIDPALGLVASLQVFTLVALWALNGRLGRLEGRLVKVEGLLEGILGQRLEPGSPEYAPTRPEFKA